MGALKFRTTKEESRTISFHATIRGKAGSMNCPCCELPTIKIYSCAEPGCNFTGCAMCLIFHKETRHSSESSAPILSAGSGEDGLPCDSSPLSQVSCGASEGCVGGNGSPATVSQRHDDGLICPEGALKTPPAGIHFAGERIDAQTSAEQLGENPLSPSMGTRLHSPAIHPRKAWKCLACGTLYLRLRQCEYDPCAVMQEVTVTVRIDRDWPLPEITELKSPPAFQRTQSTGNILDVERLEEIEAEREGSDLGGYPDPADNPYAGVRP